MGGAAGRHRASSAFPPTRSGLNAAGQAPGRSIAVYRRGAGKRPGPLPCPGEASGRAGSVRTSAAPAAVLPRSAPAPLAAARGRQRAAARGGARRGVAPLTAWPRVTGPGPRPRSPPPTPSPGRRGAPLTSGVSSGVSCKPRVAREARQERQAWRWDGHADARRRPLGWGGRPQPWGSRERKTGR